MIREKVFTLSANSRLEEPAVLPLQGSKSYTNRALIMAALAKKPVRLLNVSESDDSKALVRALGCFGVQFSVEGTTITVTPPPSLIPFKGTIDVGPAGTTMRFLAAFSSFVDGAEVELRGSERMHERPIAVLVDALRSMGAKIAYLESEGCPPLKIHGTAVRTRTVSLDGSVSSQYFSALLLLAPVFNGGFTVTVLGEQVSRSYIDMTLQAIGEFGIAIENKQYQSYHIPAEGAYSCDSYVVEGDASGASYFWGLAAISGKEVTVENINRKSLQGDVGFTSILQQMGAAVSYQSDSITVKGPKDKSLSGVVVDMEQMPDTAQTLAVVAAFARGSTKISGLQTLRIKETDRILALQVELEKLGIVTSATADSITIQGGTPSAASIATYDDHRMAMSFALLGARLSEVKIIEPDVVSKSFPDFWSVLDTMGVTSS